MSAIIRGTTPTITYTFSVVDVSTITSAYLTFVEDGETVLEKELTDAVVGEDTLSWTLTQAETLTFSDRVTLQCNWLTNSAVRGASKKTTISVTDNVKEEVI